jgi:hypothetical protein
MSRWQITASNVVFALNVLPGPRRGCFLAMRNFFKVVLPLLKQVPHSHWVAMPQVQQTVATVTFCRSDLRRPPWTEMFSPCTYSIHRYLELYCTMIYMGYRVPVNGGKEASSSFIFQFKTGCETVADIAHIPFTGTWSYIVQWFTWVTGYRWMAVMWQDPGYHTSLPMLASAIHRQET